MLLYFGYSESFGHVEGLKNCTESKTVGESISRACVRLNTLGDDYDYFVMTLNLIQSVLHNQHQMLKSPGS